MKIKIADTAGFCMGVKRAVKFTLSALEKRSGPVYTYGSLIHNSQVSDFLFKKGIRSISEIPQKGRGIIVIRAHGVPSNIRLSLLMSGFKVVDATCPHVSRVQKIVNFKTKKGYVAIIVGDENHPEVIGIVGHANSRTHVVSDIDGIKRLKQFKKAIVVAQTTYNSKKYHRIRIHIADNMPHYQIFNTICTATDERQNEAKLLADKVDIFVVIGGKHSSNTKRLKEVIESSKKPVMHVENTSELLNFCNLIDPNKTIGVTAGASTPNCVIKSICDVLRKI